MQEQDRLTIYILHRDKPGPPIAYCLERSAAELLKQHLGGIIEPLEIPFRSWMSGTEATIIVAYRTIEKLADLIAKE